MSITKSSRCLNHSTKERLTSNPRHSSQKVRSERRNMSAETVSDEMEVLYFSTCRTDQLLEEPEKRKALVFFHQVHQTQRVVI